MSRKIMLAEDSSSVRSLMAQALRDSGYEVVEAVDGKDALEKIQGNSELDLLITDLNMPNMDGIDLISTFRKQPGCRFVPVVILTGETQEDKKAEGRLAGASAWINKPFKPRQLLSLVKTVLP